MCVPSCAPYVLQCFALRAYRQLSIDRFPTGAIASLHDMISKLQRVVCHLNDRLASVEQINGIAPPAIVASATGAPLSFLHLCSI